MSPGRVAMPSSRIRAPSLIIGKIRRSMISVLSIGRRAMPRRADVSTMRFSTSGSGRCGRGRGGAGAGFVEVEALAGLLPEPPGLAQLIGDLGLEPLRLAHAPAHVE